MKRTLVLVLLLSVCFTPAVLADEPAPPDTDGINMSLASEIRADLEERAHDRGVAMMDSLLAQLQEMKEAFMSFADDIREKFLGD